MPRHLHLPVVLCDWSPYERGIIIIYIIAIVNYPLRAAGDTIMIHRGNNERHGSLAGAGGFMYINEPIGLDFTANAGCMRHCRFWDQPCVGMHTVFTNRLSPCSHSDTQSWPGRGSGGGDGGGNGDGGGDRSGDGGGNVGGDGGDGGGGYGRRAVVTVMITTVIMATVMVAVGVRLRDI